jgi:alkylhydroperoxidase AhpD family core domain
MTRVQPATQDKAQPAVQEIYKALEKKMGKVPNIFQNMGNSPAVLKGFLAFSGAAEQTSLSPKVREEIALIVAQSNNCNYCLSAHTAMSKGAGITDQEILQARKGMSQDPKTQAILAFAKLVVEKRGNVTDQDVAALKSKGVTDTEIVEIIMVISVNMFTNYFNHITDPKIDFPVAPKLN